MIDVWNCFQRRSHKEVSGSEHLIVARVVADGNDRSGIQATLDLREKSLCLVVVQDMWSQNSEKVFLCGSNRCFPQPTEMRRFRRVEVPFDAIRKALLGNCSSMFFAGDESSQFIRCPDEIPTVVTVDFCAEATPGNKSSQRLDELRRAQVYHKF